MGEFGGGGFLLVSSPSYSPSGQAGWGLEGESQTVELLNQLGVRQIEIIAKVHVRRRIATEANDNL